MKFSVSEVGLYKLVTISETQNSISELTELKSIVESSLRHGDRHMAVKFTDASYMYSGAISVLVTCYRLLREQGGNICIVEPHDRVRELLCQMNIDTFIDICSKEEELLTRID